jgi:hypothetical protein
MTATKAELLNALKMMFGWAKYGEECDPWYFSEEQAPHYRADIAEAEEIMQKAEAGQ